MLAIKLCILFLIFNYVLGVPQNIRQKRPRRRTTVREGTSKPEFLTTNLIDTTSSPDDSTTPVTSTTYTDPTTPTDPTTSTDLTTPTTPHEPTETTQPDTPTTTEEPTTTDKTEKPSTTSNLPTTTPSSLSCNSSLNSKDDLKKMIGYFDNKMSIREKIIADLNENATKINNKHKQDLDKFHSSFKSHPEHLKHILDDMNKTRQNLQSAMSEIQKLSKTYSSLQKEFESKKTKVNNVLKKVVKQMQICDITCEDNAYVERMSVVHDSVDYNPNEYYCSSIVEIHTTIIQHLKNFSEEVEIKMADDIQKKDDKYTQEVQEVKKILKSAAIREFGQTMYDILSLQDMYYHLSENISRINSKDLIKGIKSDLVNIDPKLMSLETSINVLKEFCKKCGGSPVSRSKLALLDEHSNGKQEKQNMLTILLEIHHKSLETDVGKHFTKVFHEFENELMEAQNTTIYLEELKKIESEVKTVTQEELSAFKELQIVVDDPVLNKIFELQSLSTQLLKTIKDNIDTIDKYMHKL